MEPRGEGAGQAPAPFRHHSEKVHSVKGWVDQERRASCREPFARIRGRGTSAVGGEDFLESRLARCAEGAVDRNGSAETR